MAKTGIVCGLVMCGVTVACLFVSMEKSLTQFVPMLFGIAFFVLGIVSLNPHLRYRASIFAAALAAFATLSGLGRFLVLWSGQAKGQDINELSMQAIAIMSVICFLFLAWTLLWIRKRERRRRRLNANGQKPVMTSVASGEILSPVPSLPTEPTAGEPNPYHPPRSLPADFPENADRPGFVPLSAPSQKHS